MCRHGAWNASLTHVFTTSKKMLPRFPPGDVVQVQRCHSSGAGLGKRLFCCGSLSGFMVHGSFGNLELGRRDNHIDSCFLPGHLRPTTRTATYKQLKTFPM